MRKVDGLMLLSYDYNKIKSPEALVLQGLRLLKQMLLRENTLLVQNISLVFRVTMRSRGSTGTPDGQRDWEKNIRIPVCGLLLYPQNLEWV